MSAPSSSTHVYKAIQNHPTLDLEYAPFPKLQLANLENLVATRGNDLLKISPSNVTRLKTAVDNYDNETINDLLGRQDEENSESSDEYRITNDSSSLESPSFENAIKTCQTEWVMFYIQIFAHKSFDFDEGARIIKNNFKTLWKRDNRLAEEILESNILGRHIYSINIPIEVFTDESNKARRFGTCASITDCIQTIQERASRNDSSQQNSTGVSSVHEQSKGMVVRAAVKIYCVEDVCKVGLEGILRFLLLNKAPTSVYKTPLIKHIIEFKWETHWRKQTRWRLVWFFVLYILIPTILYVAALIASVFTSKRSSDIAFSVIFAIVLLILAGLKALRAWRQCGQYIHDSQEIFPSRSWPGIRRYINSQQNIVDLFLFLMKLFIIFEVLYIVFGSTISRESPVFSGSLEFFTLLVVVEFYYRLQILKVCGVTAIMIKKIIRKCYPYFILLFLITAAFGLAMWQTRQRLHLDEDEEKEHEHELNRSFGNPLKAFLTMFYAAFGLFDPTGMYYYGSIRWLMLPIFILYLAFQMIIILNLLIAAIGDAFDGLRSIEEELFLKARADFIDRSEASLSKKKIKRTQDSIGKYLYVLVPEEKRLKKDEDSWNGRMIAIKEDVKKIVLNSQKEMTQKIDEFKEEMNQQIQNVMNHLTRE